MEIRLGSAVIVQAAMKAGTLEFRDVMSDVVWWYPRWQRPGSRTIKGPRRIHRAPPLVDWGRSRRPIQNSRDGDRRVSPNSIGLGPHLVEHVEIVLTPGVAHRLEDADIATRDVWHAQAEQRLESIGTHQPGTPR